MINQEIQMNIFKVMQMCNDGAEKLENLQLPLDKEERKLWASEWHKVNFEGELLMIDLLDLLEKDPIVSKENINQDQLFLLKSLNLVMSHIARFNNAFSTAFSPEVKSLKEKSEKEKKESEDIEKIVSIFKNVQ